MTDHDVLHVQLWSQTAMEGADEDDVPVYCVLTLVLHHNNYPVVALDVAPL